MLDNYEAHIVSSCEDCPLYGEEHFVCLHPKLTDGVRLIPADHPLGQQPPEWCPLRKACLVIDLRIKQP